MSAITPDHDPRPASVAERLRASWPVLLLVLAPVLIGLLHDDWLYSPVGFPDPYFNVGFFLHYFDPSFLPGMYKEARVPWLAPGYFAYHTLGPMAANFVLHVGCLVAAVVLVYASLKRVLSQNAAFLGAGLICAYYQFQGSGTGGWDYQTTPSGVFYALTLYMLVRAAQTPWPRFWLAGAGIAFGATFHSNIIFVNLAPGLAAIYLAANQNQPSLIEVGKSILWALFGFILINLVFSIVAWDSGRDAMFFRSMFDLAASYTVDPATNQQRWWKSWASGWYLQPIYMAYLIPLAAVFLASVAWLAERIVHTARRVAPPVPYVTGFAPLALVAQYVFAVILWVFWQTQGQTALQPDYYAYPLIIPAFMAVAVMVGPVGRREIIGFAVALAVVIVLHTLLANATAVPNAAHIAVVTVIVAMLAALAAAALLPRARGLVVLAAMVVYMAAYPTMALTHQAQQPLWSEMVGVAKPCLSPKLYFAQTVRLNKLLRQPAPDGSRTWIIDGPDEVFQASQCGIPVEYFRTTLVATGLSALGSYHARLDQLDDAEVRLAGYGDRVVAIVGDKAELAQLTERFSRSNAELVQASLEKVDLGRTSAWVAVYTVR